MPTSILLMEPTKAHRTEKLRHTLTSSFQAVGKFRIQNAKKYCQVLSVTEI